MLVINNILDKNIYETMINMKLKSLYSQKKF